MTITTEELLQRQHESARQHEIEMFKKWMATATREVVARCPDCDQPMSAKWVD
jgi:hypothetical protein